MSKALSLGGEQAIEALDKKDCDDQKGDDNLEDEGEADDGPEAIPWPAGNTSLGNDKRIVIDDEKSCWMEANLGLYSMTLISTFTFPVMLHKYGGLTFLIIYVICTILISIPMVLAELAWGQSSKLSTYDFFKDVHPKWSGMGVSATLALICVASFSVVPTAYALMYLFNSFSLPWNGFDGHISYWLENIDPQNNAIFSETFVVSYLCVILAVCVMFRFSPNFSSEIAYFTLPITIITFTSFMVKAILADGAGDGIYYFFRFDSRFFIRGDTWIVAAGQGILSMGAVGSGNLITYSRCLEVGTDGMPLLCLHSLHIAMSE